MGRPRKPALRHDMPMQKRSYRLEQILSAVFAGFDEGIVVQDALGRITLANPAAERILGLTFDELTGRTSTDPRWQAVHEDGSPFPGEDHPGMVALHTGHDVDGVVMGVHKPDGSLSWIEISARPFPGTGGARWVFTRFRDLTLDKDLVRDLRDNKRRLRQVLHQLPVLTFSFNAHGVLESLEGGGHAGQWNPAQVVGRSVDAIAEQYDLVGVKSAVARTLAGESFRNEIRILARCFEAAWEPVRHASGVVGAVGVALDVTDRLTAERELRASEDRLRMVLDGSPNLIAQCDRRGRLTYSNASFQKAVGLEAGELLGLPMHQLSPDPAESQRWLEALARVVATGAQDEVEQTVLRDGRRSWFSTRLIPLLDSEGEVMSVLAITTDITAYREYQRSLEWLTLHDPLTDLANRRLLLDRIGQALRRRQRHGGCVYLAFLDLDDFKGINDRFGHRAGDDLLRQVAGRLTQVARASDTVARLGGDEFVVVCEDSRDRSEEVIASRLLGAFEEPMLVRGDEALQVRTSIGVVEAGEETSAEVLLDRADQAMYYAKRSRRC